MTAEPDTEGWLTVGRGVRIARDAVRVRVETSGGPGGQHANRARTRVVVTLRFDEVETLRESDRRRLVAVLGPVVRSSASRFRSQQQNREAAMNQLTERLRVALVPVAPRRPTRPTASSQRRRIEKKRAHSRQKRERRTSDDE